MRNNAFEEAENVIEFLESYDLKEDPSVLYARGLLCRQRDNDAEKAKEYFEKAVKLGNDNAMFSLGKMYFYGNGVEEDFKKALVGETTNEN